VSSNRPGRCAPNASSGRPGPIGAVSATRACSGSTGDTRPQPLDSMASVGIPDPARGATPRLRSRRTWVRQCSTVEALIVDRASLSLTRTLVPRPDGRGNNTGMLVLRWPPESTLAQSTSRRATLPGRSDKLQSLQVSFLLPRETSRIRARATSTDRLSQRFNVSLGVVIANDKKSHGVHCETISQPADHMCRNGSRVKFGSFEFVGRYGPHLSIKISKYYSPAAPREPTPSGMPPKGVWPAARQRCPEARRTHPVSNPLQTAVFVLVLQGLLHLLLGGLEALGAHEFLALLLRCCRVSHVRRRERHGPL